ncbi:MAG: dTMP kinase, partial [Clostridia bacterium]|nr:dTMP kinase [Clostridia bacterium]
MKKGKLIVIEGTDCSGKETQSNLLVEELNKQGYITEKFCFPYYQSATGKIIAGPYLGKPDYCAGYFEEGATNVDPKVASLYFAADRKYNIDKIQEKLNNGINVVVDRYIDSNLAHQGAKIFDHKQKMEMFNFLETLEYKLLKLPKADITIFLYMPIDCAKKLKANRAEKPDQHEADENYLLNSEKTYLYLAKKKKYIKIDCAFNNEPKKIEEIHTEVMKKTLQKL